MKEHELFYPIASYFEAMGYEVDGEVKDIDILCKKEDTYIAIELKTELNLALLIQGAKRQKMFTDVYVAIFAPKNLRSRSFQDKLFLLKRLGIGCITVTKRAKAVSILQYPTTVGEGTNVAYQSNAHNKGKRKLVEKEFVQRVTKGNVGGVHQQKIMSAYREKALTVLSVMNMLEEGSGKDVKALTGISEATQIMYQNHYGWFHRVKKGIYTITPNGKKALDEYQDIVRVLNEQWQKNAQDDKM